MKEYHVYLERLELKTPRHSYWSENDVIDQWNRESDHEPELLCSTDSLEHARMVYDSLSTANHSLGNRLYTTVDLYSIEEVELDDDGEGLSYDTLDVKADGAGDRYAFDYAGDVVTCDPSDDDTEEDILELFRADFFDRCREAFEEGHEPDDVDCWDVRIIDREAGWEQTIADVMGGWDKLEAAINATYREGHN